MRRAFDRVFNPLRRRDAETPPKPATTTTGGQTGDAGTAIQAHVEKNAALFERATRLREKADRLDDAGTPSESARNRARRAEEEVETGLREIRALFAMNGQEARNLFDRELSRWYPRLDLSGE